MISVVSVFQIINEPVPSNCFVIYDKAVSCECVIVDPGSKRNEKLFDFLDKEKLKPKYIVLTHEHFDHCWGVKQILERYDIPIICSQLCAEAINNEKRNCSVFFDNNEGFIINSKTISTESINNVLRFGIEEIVFFSTPGHTDASISFVAGNCILTGDTLIKNMRTVTKLPTGSIKKLYDSIYKFKELQGNRYIVCPGHGDMFELDGYDLELMFEGDVPR